MNDIEDVPDLLVEKLALGELSPADEASVRARLGPSVDARLEALRTANANVLAQHPPSVVAARISRRLRQRSDEAEARSPRWVLWVGVGAIAAVAVAAVVWIAASPDSRTQQDDPGVVAVVDPPLDPGQDTVRLKGDATIVLRRQVGTGSELLAPGDTVTSGDALLVSYRAATAKHGVLVSLDGAGETTLHFPAEPNGSTALATAGLVTLHTFDLDDAPGFEHFFLVTSDKELEIEHVVRSVAALRREDPDRAAALRDAHQDWDVVDFPLVRAP